jgi:phosphatidylserine/phosphatidylglycerophosphate/cardiolipin synthase-like enzyme
VHAKVCVIDDWLLRVGNCNIKSCSMGFDTECDVAVVAQDAATRRSVAGVRNALVAEHLSASPDGLAREIERRGSMVQAMDALNSPGGRGLRRVAPKDQNALADMVAQSKLFDPRFDDDARAHKGVTSRHVVIDLGLAVAGYLLWRM